MYHILYVDDDPGFLEIGKVFLELEGDFSVDTFISASSCLTFLESGTCDVIVSDYQMPDMNGIDLLKEIRSIGNPVPFILFTGKSREEVVIQALNEGADFYIQKGGEPVSLFTELTYKIRQAVTRKRTEDALAESEERFRKLLQHVPSVSVQGYRMDGTTHYWNEASEKLYGYSAGEAVGKNLLELLIPPEMQNDVRGAIAYMAETGQPIPASELSLMKKDGSRVPVFSSHAIIKRSRGEEELFCIDIDLTENKRTEEALRLANKKLNLLSGVTRHNITNQLTVLQSFLTILNKDPVNAGNEYFRKVADAARSISAMIRFTKEYESIGVKAPVWQDCRTLVDAAAREALQGEVIRNDLPSGAEVFADPLIVKTFYNLIDNAVRHGGEITTIRFSLQESGDGPVIVCEDDGSGVPAGDKEGIFALGFGKNTGMGLFFAREILSITGITIRENGEPGKGARFEMAVPTEKYRFNPGK